MDFGVATRMHLHYANGMIKFALLLFFLLPGMASAVICKTVDADGVVGYTDVPAGECPNKVELPDYSRYSPRPIERPANLSSGSNAPAAPENFTGYTAMVISQPETNGTVRNNEGKVPVAISLQPGLQPNHTVKIYLDGTAVSGAFDGLAIELSGVDRGTHTVRASVVNAAGTVLISSDSVVFTMRKAALDAAEDGDSGDNGDGDGGDGSNGDDDKKPFDPDYGSSFTPSGDTSYEPGSGANYKPGTSGISTTPGKTNPAFKPSYSK